MSNLADLLERYNDCCARLSATEQERDELRDRIQQVAWIADDYKSSARAAEARAEAAEKGIDQAVWHLENSRRQDALSVLHDAQFARAALAGREERPLTNWPPVPGEDPR